MRVADAPTAADARRVCSNLVSALPERLGELTRRRVDGDRRAAAAWGDPPVVLQCGVPGLGHPVGQLVTIDGVDWTPEEDRAGVTWTTVGRRVTVQVRVPDRYDSQGPLLAPLSPVLRRTVPPL